MGLSAPYPSTLPPQVEAPTLWVKGAVAVASGGADYLPPYPLIVPSGYTAKLTKVTYKTRTGTVTFKLQINGVDVSGLTGLSATSTSASTSSSQAVSDGDYVAVVVTAVASTPDNMTCQIRVDLSAV